MDIKSFYVFVQIQHNHQIIHLNINKPLYFYKIKILLLRKIINILDLPNKSFICVLYLQLIQKIKKLNDLIRLF